MRLRDQALWSFAAGAWLAGAAHAQPDWPAVDAVFSMTAKVTPDAVHRYGWPRADLRVIVRDVELEPALALGSWAGFVATGAGGQVMAMGDLVLLDAEVALAVSALQAGGLEVTAIHNHLLHESPPLTYVHFMARGDAVAIGRGVRAALERTRTPPPAAAKAEPTAAELAAFAEVQDTLRRRGSVAGRVLQVTARRAERIEEHGIEVPVGLSMASVMNFQAVGDRVATTGDFVLIAAEVNPVVARLRAHGFEVTALHNHMLTESPRLFFLHFWGLDSPRKVGEALSAALAEISVAPP